MDRNSQAAKVRISELFVLWLTRKETEVKVEGWCNDALQNAKNPVVQRSTTTPPSTDLAENSLEIQGFSNNANSNAISNSNNNSISSLQNGHQDDRAPSPPASPPRQSHSTAGKNDRTPSPVNRFAMGGVDEMDMAAHRASSPGAASPVSPTALRSIAVDPALPHPMPNDGPATSPKSSSLSVPSGSNSPSSPSNVSQLLQLQAKNLENSSSNNTSMTGGHQNKLPSSSNSFAAPGSSGNFPLASTKEIPVFYRSQGACEPVPEELEALAAAFSVKNPRTQQMHVDPSKMLRRAAFGKLCQEVFDVPTVLRDVVFRRVLASSGLPDTGSSASLNYEQVKKYYEVFMARKTRARRVFELIRRDNRREHLTLDDLRGCARSFVDFHPGLAFLSQAEFQELYCKTVGIRIVHRWERNRSNTVTWAAFERSDLTDIMFEVDRSQDINSVLCYFTYEHFYVLYCRFWELDQDRDYLVTFEDLQRYSGGAITNCVLRRVVEGHGRRLSSSTPGKLNFEDFVHFCLCEEDKNNPQAIEYWFRIFDLDEDGILSGYELQEFFNEQNERLVEMGGDELQYSDMLCQMFDMVGAKKLELHKQGLTLADVKECPTAGTFFNMLMNAAKFMGFEHRDPFAEFHQKQLPEKNDWERFARAEYDRMASEAA